VHYFRFPVRPCPAWRLLQARWSPSPKDEEIARKLGTLQKAQRLRLQ
jgi:hypothetical protein